MAELLRVTDLHTEFPTDEGLVKAVDGVSFHVEEGETLGIVGESGCGKSVSALSVMRLISAPGRIAKGSIVFRGKDLVHASDAEMRHIRGDEISMIFQEPMTSLNPVYTVGAQIAESLILHQHLSRKDALDKAIEMLRRVGISLPERRANEFPHQMSGGMRQRVMIAMALACNPKLLVADEPTTALDVTIQAQILELMKELKDQFGMSIIIITHDLGVVAEMAQRVVVMYAGKVVEEADVKTIFRRPYHPYTEGLLRSIPRLDQPAGRLHVIPGIVPNPLHMPSGCRFAPRCPYVEPRCLEAEPPLVDVGEGAVARCIIAPSERKEAEAS
ncbi:MAG: ABC transporter ATP-binding protein [Thermaerobacter sp.]|nr:ABC transporter ATP-binding protein [Thermaerobacter sp.]